MKLSKTKIMICLLIIVVIGFGIYNLMWYRYIKASFDPFLKNERLINVPEQEYDRTDNGWEIYTYRDYHGSGYTYGISIPAYLEFGGHIDILTPTDVDTIDGKRVFVSEHQIRLRVFPRNWQYVLNIADLTVLDGLGDTIRGLGSATDKNGNPLGRHPDDSEEFYQEWLALHEKFNEPIMEMFRTVNELFGDALK